MVTEREKQRAVALAKVMKERGRQSRKWGNLHDSQHSHAEWFGIAQKQLGDTSRVMLNGGDLEREVVQAAAVLVAWIENFKDASHAAGCAFCAVRGPEEGSTG